MVPARAPSRRSRLDARGGPASSSSAPHGDQPVTLVDCGEDAAATIGELVETRGLRRDPALHPARERHKHWHRHTPAQAHPGARHPGHRGRARPHRLVLRSRLPAGLGSGRRPAGSCSVNESEGKGERMATPTSLRVQPAAGTDQLDGRRPADVFVSFGITGRPREGHDLPVALPAGEARPARLPGGRRGGRRLDEPRPAPATRVRRSRPASRWTRPSSSASRGRLSYVQGDFADAATFERLAAAIAPAHPASVLPRDPAVPVRHRRRAALPAPA